MNNTKATIVTALVTVLLGIAAFAAYRLCMPAFIILTAIFAGIGFLSAASFFCAWLETEPRPETEKKHLPATDIKNVEDALQDADFSPIEEEARAET